jgi:hypothetical protein
VLARVTLALKEMACKTWELLLYSSRYVVYFFGNWIVGIGAVIVNLNSLFVYQLYPTGATTSKFQKQPSGNEHLYL